ncbi:MAG: hypothetical protein IKN38_09550 [Clostridia bacterium]|nr:hypothetical protein [Clostridia bacterium]
MKKRLIAILLLTAIVAASLILIISRGGEESGSGEAIRKDALVIGAAKIEGSFSPFRDGSDGDETVKNIVYPKIASREGDSSPSVTGLSAASDMEVFFADKDREMTEKFKDGGYTAVRYTLKDAVRFSNGSPLEAVDVLFSLYMTLDPASNVDKSAFLSLDGYTDYVYGKSGVSKEMKRAYEIIKNDTGEEASYGNSYTRQNALDMREILASCGEKFAEEIREYVAENYCTDEMTSSYILDTVSERDVAESEALKNAYAIRMWNYGSFIYNYAKDEDGDFVGVEDREGNITVKATYDSAIGDDAYLEYFEDEDGDFFYDRETSSYREAEKDETPRYSRRLDEKYIRISRKSLAGFRDSEGTSYTLEGDSYPTMSDFFMLMKDSYVADGVFDYEKMEKIESAGAYSFSAQAAEEYALSHAKGEEVTEISGIVSEKDGEGRDTLTLFFEGNDYDAAVGAVFPIVSMSSCMEGYDTGNETLNICGAPINSPSLFEHIEKVEYPASFGPYAIVRYDVDEKTVYLEKNEYFSTAGYEEAAIDDVTIRDVSDADTAELLSEGDIAINVAPIKKDAKDIPHSAVKTLYYPNNSYKYLLINPAYYKNLECRLAIASVIDTSAVTGDAVAPTSGYVPTYFDSYTPDDNVSFDRDGSSALRHLEAAGYKKDGEGNLIDPATGEIAKFVFTLLPEEEGGDVEMMIAGAIDILRKIGADGEIVFDPDLKTNVYSDEGVAIYVLGWEVDRTTSLFERYAYSSKTSAVKGCGISSLFTAGQIDKLGKLSYVDIDGKKKNSTQSDAVDDIDRALCAGDALIDRDERCAAFKTAQKIISALTFEIPVCEYNNAYQVREDVVDMTSLYTGATSEKGPLSEIWKIRFASQD